MSIMSVEDYVDHIKSAKRRLNIELSRLDVIEFALRRKKKYYADNYDVLTWEQKHVLKSDIGWLDYNIEFIEQDIRWLVIELKDLYLYGF